MFDPYCQMRDHARKVAYLHPKSLRTWQDAVREQHESDVDFRLNDSLSQSPLFALNGLYRPVLVVALASLLLLASCTAPFSGPSVTNGPASANMPNPASV
jgi:hypothetical protein